MSVIRLFPAGFTQSFLLHPTMARNTPPFKTQRRNDIQQVVLGTAISLFIAAEGSSAEIIPRTSVKTFDVPGSTQTWPEDINNKMTVVGGAHNPDNGSFIYRKGVIEPAGAHYEGINDRGDIVGFTSAAPAVGFIQTADSYTEIEPTDENGVLLRDINNHGTIVGRYHDSEAVVLRNSELLPLIPNWEGIQGSEANGINDNDVVVGNYWDDTGRSTAFIYDNGLKTVNYPNAFITNLTSINNSGLAVGYHDLGDETTQGFAYYKGKLIPIEVGQLSTLVSGINDWGFITGRYSDSWETGEHGFTAHILQFVLWDLINKVDAN